MEPKTFPLSPTTTVKKVDVYEDDCLLTVENMDSTVDVYVGTDDGVPWRVPAGATREILGDFRTLYYKSASAFGSSDHCYIVVERGSE